MTNHYFTDFIDLDTEGFMASVRPLVDPAVHQLFYGAGWKATKVCSLFNDGDKIYLLGAVHPATEKSIKDSLKRSGAKVSIIRQR